ncbi:uncharacterized protein EHS24_000482 [Apiotrichum porosum]|uniref:J domain-containing protein n=1 Tax=Apiotrichum porosum TaxID=105984 RepID=A0A427Y9X4_9TREE|nr:uncharacterized protein EHS24_000482 [Apiotrichum porosum]RSH87959.1 hypothetical protein EHS24_000482 [Apiotrichum porosum]
MSLPQYYSILGIQSTATSEDIRQAYRKESLRTHPDRLPGTATAEERRRATERFQAVADAYYVLSDPGRRAEYDRIFRSRPASAFETSTDPDAQERASSNFFEEFARFFTAGTGTASAEPGSASAGPSGGRTDEKDDEGAPHRPNAEHVFGDVFEDLLEPEVAHVHKTWTYVGGAAGAALGFIVANAAGAVAGAFAGSQLGRVRDAKGKPVAQVFAGLPMSQKTQILRALAFKVLGTMQ